MNRLGGRIVLVSGLAAHIEYSKKIISHGIKYGTKNGGNRGKRKDMRITKSIGLMHP